MPSVLFTPDARLRPIWRFLLGVAVFFAAEFLSAAFASFVPGGHPLLFNLLFEFLDVVLLIAGFGFLLIVADRTERSPIAAMGLTFRVPWLRESLTGFALGATLVALAFLVLAVTGCIASITYTLSSQSLPRAVIVFLLLTFGALSEELAFRGYPFQRLVEAVGAAPAIVLVSLLFGGMHASNPHATIWGVLNTALFGVLASLAYLRTRALWLPWGIHFGWNLTLGLLLGLPVSGLSLFSVLGRTVVTGPEWLTGGAYGIEGSATGTLAMAAGVVAVLASTRKRRESQAPPPA